MSLGHSIPMLRNTLETQYTVYHIVYDEWQRCLPTLVKCKFAVERVMEVTEIVDFMSTT